MKYVEVFCRSTETTHRFTVGTKAGYAVSVINRKVPYGKPFALHIEAIKDGEVSIAFGNDAELVDYGDGWRLVTYKESEKPEAKIRFLTYKVGEAIVFGNDVELVDYGGGRRLVTYKESEKPEAKTHIFPDLQGIKSTS